MPFKPQPSLIVVGALLHMLASADGMPPAKKADIAWTASGEFCEPETVLPLPDKTFLVTNVCAFKTAGSGFVSLLNGEGKVLNWRVIDKLDSPLGMALVDETLYIVDTNRVRMFMWPDYTEIETIDLETRVANDIAVAKDGTIYVSDSANNQVVRRRPDGTQSVLTGTAQFKSANGMAIDGNHLYVGGARLWCVNLSDNTVTTIGPEWLADIDGIEFEEDGALQLTIVGGPLVRYQNENNIEILGGEGVSSTNHGYSAQFGLALIPTGYDNTVVAVRIK